MTARRPTVPRVAARTGRPDVDSSRYPALRAFLRGYLHEDFLVDFGTAAAAAAAFAADASAGERTAVLREWRRLEALMAGSSLAELRETLTEDFGSAWRPATRRDVARVFERVASRPH